MINCFNDDISIIRIPNNVNDEENNKMQDLDKNFELSIVSKIEKKDEQIKCNKANIDNNNEPNNPLDSLVKQKRKVVNNSFKSYNLSEVKSENNKKLKKEDLDNIPLPIFSCIYCSNEKVSFTHFSNEIISNKYLFQTSIYDLKLLDYLIDFNFTSDNFDKNNKLLNIYLTYSEYLKSFYQKEQIKKFFIFNNFKEICKKNELIIKNNFKYLFENILIRKKMKFCFREVKDKDKISKNSNKKNKCLYISNSHLYNSSGLNGFIGDNRGLGGISDSQNSINNEKKNITLIGYNSSSINLFSKTFNNNDIDFLKRDNNNCGIQNENFNSKILINEYYETEERKEIFDSFSEDELKRKITKNDIEWENKYYDVYNPIIDDDIVDADKKSCNEKIYIKFNKSSIISSKNCEKKEQIFVHSENNIFKYLKNKKLTIFSNNKSFMSTNNSSNMNIRNNSKDISNFKILNNASNNNNSNININIENKKYTSPSGQNNKTKIYNYNRTPSYSKVKLMDIYSKSKKKLVEIKKFKNLKERKNRNKKLLFNNNSKIKNEIYDSDLKLKIKKVVHNNKRNYNEENKYLINNYSKNMIFNINRSTQLSKKLNILSDKNNLNSNKMPIINSPLLNLTGTKFKNNEIKNNNINPPLKTKNGFKYSPYEKIQNSVYKKGTSPLILPYKKHIEIKNSENENNYIKIKDKPYNLKNVYKMINKFKAEHNRFQSMKKIILSNSKVHFHTKRKNN